MKTSLAIQCIILLACMAFCSSLVIPKCRCLNNSKWVKPALIAAVQEFGLRAFCNNREVIVTLKDGNKRCLDPESKFTVALLEKINQLRRGHEVTKKSAASATAPKSKM